MTFGSDLAPVSRALQEWVPLVQLRIVCREPFVPSGDFWSSSRQIEMNYVSMEVRLHDEVAGDRAVTTCPTSHATTRLFMRGVAPPQPTLHAVPWSVVGNDYTSETSFTSHLTELSMS